MDPIPVPVGILRLPRGPDSSGSRGFSRTPNPPNPDNSQNPDNSPNPDNSQNPDNSRNPDPSRSLSSLQAARAALRARFLRLLGLARARPVRFRLWNGTRVDAEFGAADLHCGAFQVDSLQTPLGIQSSALLRSGDVLEFSFPLE